MAVAAAAAAATTADRKCKVGKVTTDGGYGYAACIVVFGTQLDVGGDRSFLPSLPPPPFPGAYARMSR